MPRELTSLERAYFKPYFQTQVLLIARVVEGRVPWWLFPQMCAVVLGNTIYIRADVYHAHTAHGLALLGHELMHVAQFYQGMSWWRYLWSCRHGYRRSPYEVQAYALGAQIKNDFLSQ